jgi:hypothetical protein
MTNLTASPDLIRGLDVFRSKTSGSRLKAGMTAVCGAAVLMMALASPSLALDTSYSLNKPDANAQAGSDAGEGGYYAILPETEVQGLEGERMVVWFQQLNELPSQGVLDDAALIEVCGAKMPFVAGLPSTTGADPAERLFAIGAFRNREDGSGKSDRALLAAWRVKEGCNLD